MNIILFLLRPLSCKKANIKDYTIRLHNLKGYDGQFVSKELINFCNFLNRENFVNTNG